MHNHVLDEYEKLGNVVRAVEDWSKDYQKSPDTFAKLIKVEGTMERNLIGYFTGLADRAVGYVNWFQYNGQVRAIEDFRVDVLITDSVRGYEDGLFIQAMYNPIETAVGLGAQAGDDIYKIPLGITKSSAVVQQIANEQTAFLVGKRIDKTGAIIDNPNAKYSVTEATRKDIRRSISTSLNLGETQDQATTRLRSVIKDPRRASKIAATEAVNGYQGGLYAYAKESGAVGKEWQTIAGACPLCVGNANAGPVSINDNFPSGDKSPAAHPWDRCSLRFIYPEDPSASKITSQKPGGFDATNLETIAQNDISGRPNAEINTAIEKLLNSDDPAAVRDSIALALQLPSSDAVAMLNSITYQGKSVVDSFYQTKFDVATKKITKVLKDPRKDPLKMSAIEIGKLAGVPDA